MVDKYRPLAEQLVRHGEGLRLKPYKCSAGYWTIGFGRNLDANSIPGRPLASLVVSGITKAEAEALLKEDMQRAEDDVRKLCSVFHLLSPLRQAILIDISFNIGRPSFSKFSRFWGAVYVGAHEMAAYELLDSQYQRDVKGRAWRNAIMWASNKPLPPLDTLNERTENASPL